ncbi:hypothetical protein SHKM778_16670 [Streptomyces sp. KM77-8]|uniref:Uncharacterized protein n=1 Tax=Streptomyces haneummycinicus TaxID=3074435 RepID=A0AAT9HD24_9ACTN
MANNVNGLLPGHRDASLLAERFARAGWRSTSSSWHGYEVGTSWCEVDLTPLHDETILLNGVIAPHRLDALATLLTRFGLPYTLELYAEDGTLLRELRR